MTRSEHKGTPPRSGLENAERRQARAAIRSVLERCCAERAPVVVTWPGCARVVRGRFHSTDETTLVLSVPVETPRSTRPLSPCALSFCVGETIHLALTYEASQQDCLAASNYVRLHLPHRIIAERRTALRVPVAPGYMGGVRVVPEEDAPRPGELVDVSLTGARVHVPHQAGPPLARGASLTIHLGTSRGQVAVPAEVRHCTGVPDRRAYGLRFRLDASAENPALEALVREAAATWAAQPQGG